jgi:drug/metabolite transporter (DMT)-like permease
LPNKPSPHTTAFLQAFLVTFLWSTSWVLIKIGLQDIPPLVFSGVRYALAFLMLLPLALRPWLRAAFRSLRPPQWALLTVFGLIQYTLVQGAAYLGLAGLPAATVGLLLNFTLVVVAIMGVVLLGEHPGWLGWTGVACSILGALVYFYPATIPTSQLTSLVVVGIAVLGNAAAVVMGRRINRGENIPPLLVTTVSMGVGGMVLFAIGVGVDGLPQLDGRLWAIIAWLALVNTAFAFTLWNRTQRTLPAVESSLINNTMVVQIALLVWLFLGESLSLRQWLGMFLAMAGVALLQLSYLPRHRSEAG